MPNQSQALAFARELLERLAVPTEADIATATEFLRLHAGKRTTFYREVLKRSDYDTTEEWGQTVASKLAGWITLAEAGFAGGGAVTRSRQLAATDLMEQVEVLLEDQRVHPVAPVVLAAAALEELLRSLLDERGVEPRGKPGISSFAKALREEDALSAQDVKNITAWAGLRNQAAHGQFDQVTTEAARIMAMGVNLFMQSNAAEATP